MVNLKIFISAAVITVLGAAFFLLDKPQLTPVSTTDEPSSAVVTETAAEVKQPEAAAPSAPVPARQGDAPRQPHLLNPPKVIKGIYITGWVAGGKTYLKPLIQLVNDTELNAVVIDIKDYSGYVSYKTGIPEVAASGAENEPRIAYPNRLIEELHKNGIYVIARQTVFQDSILSKAHPEWAVMNSAGSLWQDRKGLHWMDTASKDVWDYNIAIAKDALDRGFDEVNFDYIRFPSDGNLEDARYPVWDKENVLRETVIRQFFAYLREQLQGGKISADLFGLVTIARDDLGIGQKMEYALPYFDAVMPMVYPSHYANGTFGYKNPADHPYEVVHQSMAIAFDRWQAMQASSSVPLSSLRPWLQAFDLGATYDSAKIAAQIKAVDDALGTGDANGGWVLWDPKNKYTSYQN
jgi:hypothetical protein